jgi:hypothetical protein
MREPRQNVDVRGGVDDICPKCQSIETTITLKTAYGRYCRCDRCGHLWHNDEPPPA